MKRLLTFVCFLLISVAAHAQALTEVYGQIQNSSVSLYSGVTFDSRHLDAKYVDMQYYDNNIVVGKNIWVNSNYTLYRVPSSGTELSFTPDLFSRFIYPVSKGIVQTGFVGPYNFYTNNSLESFTARWIYVMPAPMTLGPTGPVCGNISTTIRSYYDAFFIKDAYVDMFTIWEYNINNAGWTPWDSTRTADYQFMPVERFPVVATGKTGITFRTRIKAQYATVTYYSPYSPASNSIEFLPAAPVINAANVFHTDACAGENNGTITVPDNVITGGVAQKKWILRKGTSTVPCDPGGTTCGDLEEWSEGSVPMAQGFSIGNLKPDTYSLWLINSGGDAGNCFTPIVITIGQFNPIAITQTSLQHLSCYGAADGAISVNGSGGNTSGTYYFTLFSGATVIRARQAGTGNTITWQNLTAGTYTARAENSSCGTYKEMTITVNQPPQILGVSSAVSPTCTTPGNGSIMATGSVPAGFTRPDFIFKLYKDDILVDQSVEISGDTYTFTGLAGGAYKIEILNAAAPLCPGWTKSETLAPLVPLALQLTTRDSVSCYGGSDGRLQFTATGGTGLYEYTLNGVSNTTGLFTGLAAGTYTVQLKNQATTCNDEISQSFTVFQRAVLGVQLPQTDITCADQNDGVLKATVSGGSGSYSYNWQRLNNGIWSGNSGWFSTDTQIEALAAGTYRVIVTDNKSTGCAVTSVNAVIENPATVVITDVTVTDAVCLAEGAFITMTGTGGDGQYTYAWSLDGGNTYHPFTATTGFTTAGKYALRLSDGKGCTADAAALHEIVLPATALNFTTQQSDYHGFNISCKDATDGKITVTATGGNGGTYTGYEYRLNSDAYQSSGIFDGLVAGTYTVTVKDGRGCEVTKTIVLSQPTIYLNAVKHDVDCYGKSTGSISINVNGGVTPYHVTMNGTTVNAGATFNTLPAGDYLFHITDGNGCIKDSTIKIVNTYPALIITDAVVHDISCVGEAGSIAITSNGGDGAYTYSISNNNWNTSGTYMSGGDLYAGSYKLRVTDNHGCMYEYPETLVITAPPTAVSFTAVLSDYNGFNISCVGGHNGFAQLTPAGGNGAAYSGYTYALDNGAYSTDPLVSGINAGAHILRVKDARGCVVSNSYTFTESSMPIDLVLVSKQNVPCTTTPSGRIIVAGSGGASNLQYTIDNVNWQNSGEFTGLVAGTYTIMVRDINGCTNTLSEEITSANPAILIDNITPHDVVCYGEKGSINIAAHGGTGTLVNEYAWSAGTYNTFNNTTALEAGTYTVRVKDGVGCYSRVSDIITITNPPAALTAVITTSDYNGTQISCYGLADGSFSIAAGGGNGNDYTGYQYSVSNSTYTVNNSYSNLSTGTYTVKIKDARGCVITQQATMQQPVAPLSLSVLAVEDLICGADPTGVITLQSAGGTAPYMFTGGNAIWQESAAIKGLTAGNYTLEVKDANGCVAQNSAIVNTKYTAITATADITPVVCYGEVNGAIRLHMAGGDGVYQYVWQTGTLSGSEPGNLAAGTYSVKVTDGKGCIAAFSYEVAQPDRLTLETTAPAICDGLREGVIDAAVTGGIMPYSYSLNETEFIPDNSFTDLTVGTYNLLVKDANGCTISKDVVVGAINTMPAVNFLVASRKNAFDTLAITEISLPAPDNIIWSYHPKAILLGYEDGKPLIKFSEAGTYWIGMTATFGSCTYTVKKDLVINPYDPIAGPGYSVPVHVIDTVTMSPNPNNGTFTFHVKLNRKQQAVVYVYDMSGVIAAKKQYAPVLQIDDSFSVNGTAAGTYILRVITESESRDVRFIISR